MIRVPVHQAAPLRARQWAENSMLRPWAIDRPVAERVHRHEKALHFAGPVFWRSCNELRRRWYPFRPGQMEHDQRLDHGIAEERASRLAAHLPGRPAERVRDVA